MLFINIYSIIALDSFIGFRIFLCVCVCVCACVYMFYTPGRFFHYQNLSVCGFKSLMNVFPRNSYPRVGFKNGY